MISGKSCYGKNFMGLMLLHMILHTYHGPWTAIHQRASWNYQPSISPSLRLPFIYQDHVDTHEFTFFLRIPSLPNRSNRTLTGLAQRSAFNSVRSKSLWPLKIAELQREDANFYFFDKKRECEMIWWDLWFLVNPTMVFMVIGVVFRCFHGSVSEQMNVKQWR